MFKRFGVGNPRLNNVLGDDLELKLGIVGSNYLEISHIYFKMNLCSLCGKYSHWHK